MNQSLEDKVEERRNIFKLNSVGKLQIFETEI